LIAWLLALACDVPTAPLAPPPTPPSPRGVLLVTLDTTRADALGAYGGPFGLTPHLDRLASEGVVFDEAIATAPLTAPAHASLLTGRYPFAHGVRNNLHYTLRDDVPTLPEAFSEAGWATAAFVSASVLDARIGLDRGFDHYVDDVPDRAPTPMAVPSRDGAEIVDLAATWFHDQVRHHPTQPVFLWVHLYDAHAPYAPAPAFRDRHQDPYLAEIAELDHHVGSLVRALTGRDPARRWTTAVIGDHGEGRGDHGEAAHGLFLYRSTLRVPWLLAGPGVPEGVRMDGPVSQVDLPATIASLAGLTFPAGEGVDLAASFSQPAPSRPPVYAETLVPLESYGLAPMFAVQGDPWKVVFAPRTESWDWRVDPDETRALEEGEPVAAAARWMEAHPGAGEPPVRGDPSTQLQALGYLAGVPGGLTPEPSERPHPGDHADLPERVAATVHRAHTLPPRRGAALLDELLADHPGVLQLHGELAMAWGAADEPRRGLEVLDQLDLPESHPYVATRRAELLWRLGRQDDALAVLRAAHEAAPAHAQLAIRYAAALHHAGRHLRAASVIERADLSSQSLAAQLLRGRLALALGRPADAVEPLQRALELAPDHPEVLRLLAPTLATVGWREEAIAIARHALSVDSQASWALALIGRMAYARGGCRAAEPQLTALRALAPPPPSAQPLLRDCPSPP